MLGRMRKICLMMALVAVASLQAAGQTACPIALTEGHSDHDSIRVAVRNKGKVPIEQFSLVCKPGAGGTSRGAVCHSEIGVFYPGTPYWISLPYPDANHHEVAISVNTAQLAGGVLWTLRSVDSCHTLRVRPVR